MDSNRRRATDVVKVRTRPTTTVSKLGISGLGEQVRFDFRFSFLLSSPRLSAGDQLISRGISDG